MQTACSGARCFLCLHIDSVAFVTCSASSELLSKPQIVIKISIRSSAFSQSWFLAHNAVLAQYMLLPHVCLSVCLSQVGVLSNGRTNRAGYLSATRLPSIYPTLCFELIRVSPKIRVLLTLKLCMDFENFAAIRRSSIWRHDETRIVHRIVQNKIIIINRFV